jgi:uncharacterized membrane protein
MYFTHPMWSVVKGVSAAGQLKFIADHPFAYLRILGGTVWRAHFYYTQIVGVLSWWEVPLPAIAYALPLLGVVAGTLAEPQNELRLRPFIVVWEIILLAGSVFLTITSAYLLWHPVGFWTVDLVWGRYFFPLVALFAAVWRSVVRVQPSRQMSQGALVILVMVIIAESIITDLTIVSVYQLF